MTRMWFTAPAGPWTSRLPYGRCRSLAPRGRTPMAETLKARLLDSDRRGAVVDDLQLLVDAEVANKSGLSGGIVKTGYAAVKKVKPGIIPEAIDKMLDEFVEQLEPFWATFTTEAAGDFGTFLGTRPQEASEALLTVTDRRAER